MSIRELYEWYEYYSEEPFIADRLENQLARLSAMVGNFGGSKQQPKEFMIRNVEARVLTQEEDDKRVSNMFSMIGKKD